MRRRAVKQGVCAVIPAAGRGTRFHPFSTIIPKELVPVLSRPVIEYVLEELLCAGISDLVLVTNGAKRVLEEYVSWCLADREPGQLGSAGAAWPQQPLPANLGAPTRAFVHQPVPLGLGDAVRTAAQAVGSTSCLVALPDNFFWGGRSPTSLLLGCARRGFYNVIAVSAVSADQTSKYGIVSLGREVGPGCFEITGIVEKPPAGRAPSCYASVGRYLFSPLIFDALTELGNPPAGAELQLPTGINRLLARGVPVYAQVIEGTFLDVGTPQTWLEANNFVSDALSAARTILAGRVARVVAE